MLITGSLNDDILIGTDGDDVIFGLGGNDSLYGENGVDTLDGGAGDDYLTGGQAGDNLVGGTGFDHALYSLAASGIVADLANPLANSGQAAGDRYDSIEGLAGSTFDDSLRGDGGNNLLWGGDGSDSLYGRDGNDTLIGGAGNDYLTGGEGADTLIGGAGFDTVLYSFATSGLTVDLLGRSPNSGEAIGDNFDSIEGVAGSPFNDVLRGTDGGNILWGGDGSDRLSGRGGDDTLVGGAGDDYLEGGPGIDWLIGGEGFDFADYTNSATSIWTQLYLQRGSLYYPAQESFGDVYSSIEGIIGSAFNDMIYGDERSNVLRGGAGDDGIYGWGGGDVIDGGPGDDYLYGGRGVDTFIIDVGYGRERIETHDDPTLRGTTPVDVFQLSVGLGVNSFADVLARAQYIDYYTVITFDANTSIILVGVTIESLSASNFVFV